MNPSDFLDDIPIDVARAAHRGTSFSPEQRGDQERDHYSRQLARDYAALAKFADTDGKRASLVAEFARYRNGYRDRYLRRLMAMSRCMSTMITGGSKFPVARQAKASDRADKCTTELIEYRERAIAAIRRALDPAAGPVMAGDADAVERLTAKIAEAERAHERMKDANEAIRRHKADSDAPTATRNALTALGFTHADVTWILAPDPMGRIGFPTYAIQNSGAELRRLRARLEALTAAKATPASECTSPGGIRLEDAPADNRVRLFFPDKPDAAVRERLKRNGFRWTPSLGCWQAYRNGRSLDFAKAAVVPVQVNALLQKERALVEQSTETFTVTEGDRSVTVVSESEFYKYVYVPSGTPTKPDPDMLGRVAAAVRRAYGDCTDHWHCDPAAAAHTCDIDRTKACPSCGEAPAPVCPKSGARIVGGVPACGYDCDHVPGPRCGCPVNAPEADPTKFACPCGDHCTDPQCAVLRPVASTVAAEQLESAMEPAMEPAMNPAGKGTSQ